MANPRVTFYRADIDIETKEVIIHRLRRVNRPDGYCETEDQARAELEQRLADTPPCAHCEPDTEQQAPQDEPSTNEEQPSAEEEGTTSEKSKVDESGTPNEDCKVEESGVTSEKGKVIGVNPAREGADTTVRSIVAEAEGRGVGNECLAVLKAMVWVANRGSQMRDGYIPLQAIALAARMTRAKTRTYLGKLVAMRGLIEQHPTMGIYRFV